MFSELLSLFHGSSHAQNATAVLQQQGVPEDQIQGILDAALHGAARGMHAQTEGHAEPALGLFNIFGGHSGREFLLGATAGLLRGEGLWGAAKDGAMGMITGHVAEVIAQRTGMNQEMAGQLAAVVTPFVVHYAHEKLGDHAAVTAVHGHHKHHKHHH